MVASPYLSSSWSFSSFVWLFLTFVYQDISHAWIFLISFFRVLSSWCLCLFSYHDVLHVWFFSSHFFVSLLCFYIRFFRQQLMPDFFLTVCLILSSFPSVSLYFFLVLFYLVALHFIECCIRMFDDDDGWIWIHFRLNYIFFVASWFHLFLFFGLVFFSITKMFQYFVSFCFFSIFFYFTLRMGILIESIPLVFFLLIGILLVSFQVLVLFCFTKKFLLFTFSYWRLICLIFLDFKTVLAWRWVFILFLKFKWVFIRYRCIY